MPKRRDDDVSWSRRTLRSFLELVGICGLAVVEPVLASFRDGADVFVLRHASPLDVVLFTLAVVFVPALVLLAFELAFSLLGRTVQRVVHAIFLGVATGFVVLGFVKEATSWSPWLLVTFAVVLGIGAAVGFFLVPTARLWLRYLAAFPAVLGVAFLFASPVTDIVLGRETATAAGVHVDNPVPVMMIVLDELPLVSILDADNHVNAAQFPNLARLAGDSTWFRNDSSVAPSTPQAVPAILTGDYPTDPDELPIDIDYPDNLFTLLGGTYAENVFEGVTRLCPDDVCPESQGIYEGSTIGGLLDDAVDVWNRHMSPDRAESQVEFQIRQSNPNAPATMQDFIESMAPSGSQPRLDFLHVLYPHQPWFHLPSGYQYEAPFVAKGLSQTYSWEGQQVADAARQRHLLQLKHADAMVGAILDRMDDLGTYDDSLIVLTADHGVAFTSGNPIRGLSSENAPQIMWTPLFVKRPNQSQPEIDDRPVIAVDVLPTIADELGVDIPWEVDGRSAFGDTIRPEDADRPFFEWRLNALQPTDGHYVHIDGEDGFRRMLAADPPGRGSDPELRLYRFGRWGPLVGTSVADVPKAASRYTGLLDHAADFRDVDHATGTIPAYVSGSVRVPVGDVDGVAVAVNGTIAGWSELHSDSAGRSTWWTMVPEWLLEDGENEVELFELTGDLTSPLLRPIALG